MDDDPARVKFKEKRIERLQILCRFYTKAKVAIIGFHKMIFSDFDGEGGNQLLSRRNLRYYQYFCVRQSYIIDLDVLIKDLVLPK